MPITAPVESTSGPPELPGLIAASVWMASITASAPESPASSRTGRSSALTMPWVTVPTRPSGEPMAITRVADGEPRRRPDRRHHGVRDVDLDDGQVRLRVAADDARGSARAVGEDGVQPAAGADRGRRDDVVVGEHVAVALDHDPGPGAGLLADPDLQRHDGGDRARGDVGHRAGRPFLALGDGGQRGAGIGEPRGAVRGQPPDEATRGADEERDQPEEGQRPPLHPAAEQDLAQAQPGALARRAAGRGPVGGRRRAERGGAAGVAPRVVVAGPERGVGGCGPGPAPGGRCRRDTVPAGRPKARARAAGGGAVERCCRAGRTAPPRRTRRRPRSAGRRRPPNRRRRRAGPAGGAPGAASSPFDSGTARRRRPAGRTQGSPSDSLITDQPASAAVKSA